MYDSLSLTLNISFFSYSCRTSNRKSLICNGQSPAMPRPHSPLSAHAGIPTVFMHFNS